MWTRGLRLCGLLRACSCRRSAKPRFQPLRRWHCLESLPSLGQARQPGQMSPLLWSTSRNWPRRPVRRTGPTTSQVRAGGVSSRPPEAQRNGIRSPQLPQDSTPHRVSQPGHWMRQQSAPRSWSSCAARGHTGQRRSCSKKRVPSARTRVISSTSWREGGPERPVPAGSDSP